MATKHPNITDLTDCACYPHRIIDESAREFGVTSYKAPDGRQQKLLTRATKLRRWRLNYEGKTETEMVALRAFYDARYGSFGLCYFDDPKTGETDIPIYIVAATWQETLETSRARKASLEIEETVE